MRDIIFRGQRKADLKWVYGGYHKHEELTPSPIISIGEKAEEVPINYLIIQDGFSDWNMPKPIQAHEVYPESVGQFTGLKDCNGKEIYEGDIVKNGWHIFRVDFYNGAFSLGTYPIATLPNFSVHYEIIGNIYENPELL